MKLSELINTLSGCLEANGDMDIFIIPGAPKVIPGYPKICLPGYCTITVDPWLGVTSPTTSFPVEDTEFDPKHYRR
jgi:hypothetical protein